MADIKEIPLSKYSMDEDVFLRADNQMSQAEAYEEYPKLHGMTLPLKINYGTPFFDRLYAALVEDKDGPTPVFPVRRTIPKRRIR
jgi:hypothetical protein